ncbi:MAG: hypothetical protein ABI765_04610 [Gemmatimonadota bacterium]
MLRYALWPKVALPARRARRWLIPLLAAAACQHSGPFQTTAQDPTGPRSNELPRQVTLSGYPDLTPARSGSGADWLYTYTEPGRPGIINFCIAGMPLDGGGRTRTYCDVALGRFGLTTTITWPAESPDGRLAYIRSRGVPNSGPSYSTALILGSFAPRDSGRILRSFPYRSPQGLVRSATHIGWLNHHTLLFVATDIIHPGFASQDTAEGGLQIERLDVDQPSGTPDVMPGTAFASSVEPMADGSGFFFTLLGDPRVYRRKLAGGTTDPVYDFGGPLPARDVRFADSVLYAVVGGIIQTITDTTDTTETIQWDFGGTLMRVDLRSGLADSLVVPGLLVRHPALSGDHHRLLVETVSQTKDLWLVEAP